jgi:hypothetical protein
MNTYHVYLKKGGLVQVNAEGYTEDQEVGRFYFHSDLQKEDKITFFNIANVEGIHAFETSNDSGENLARFRETLAALQKKNSSESTEHN